MNAAPRTPLHPWSLAVLWLAVLAGVLLVFDRWPGPAASPLALTQIDAQQVQTLRIERDKRLQLAMRRSPDGWHLEHPVNAPVRAERVAQLLAVIRAPVRYAFSADGDLTRYGLSRPATVLRIDDAVLAFGNREPAQTGRYVLANGQVHVIDDVFFNLLSLPPSHFTGD